MGGYTTIVTHAQYQARPTITFPATECHRLLTAAKLYYLVTGAPLYATRPTQPLP